MDSPPHWLRCPADEQFHAFADTPAPWAVATAACGYTAAYLISTDSPEARRCPGCRDLALAALGDRWHEASQWLT